MNTFETSPQTAALYAEIAGEPWALPGQRVSRVDALRAQPRKPGEAAFFYVDPHFQYDTVKVFPGEYFVARDDLLLMTVVGSCVAACVWDGAARVGGMNRFMLPEGGPDAEGLGARAMEHLLDEMRAMGARRETMQARVFGGGAVMPRCTTTNVGERNTRFVLDYLAAQGIPVVAQDVLGTHPRKVCFFPATGKALLKRLAHTHPEALAVEERRANAGAVVPSAGGSVASS